MTRASTQFGTSREIASRIEYCTGKKTPGGAGTHTVNILRNGKVARERERAFALLAFFVDVDVGVLAPVLLL